MVKHHFPYIYYNYKRHAYIVYVCINQFLVSCMFFSMVYSILDESHPHICIDSPGHIHCKPSHLEQWSPESHSYQSSESFACHLEGLSHCFTEEQKYLQYAVRKRTLGNRFDVKKNVVLQLGDSRFHGIGIFLSMPSFSTPTNTLSDLVAKDYVTSNLRPPSFFWISGKRFKRVLEPFPKMPCHKPCTQKRRMGRCKAAGRP